MIFFLLTNTNLRKFINSQSNFSNILEVLKKNEKYSIRISKNPRPISYKSVNQFSKESLSSYRFNTSELVMPYIVKNNFPMRGLIKDYQGTGIKWLKKEGGKILADDMGLGKTLQSVVASCEEITKKEIGTVLIACPSSLVINWGEEINKWAPYFCVSSFVDTGNLKKEIWKKLFGYNHFVITNYEQLREIPKLLETFKLNLVILDEAHKVRKGSSKIFKTLNEIKYEKVWALTGTPIEKNTRDACHILKIVDPKRDLYDDLKLSNDSLRSVLKQYTLRRMKADFLEDLSDFEHTKINLVLNDIQKKSYKEILKNKSKKSSNHLDLFNKLREICDFDPATKSSCKIDFILDLLEKIKLKNEKCVIFSFWLEPLYILEEKINKTFGNNSSVVFTGDLDKKERNDQIKKFNKTSSFVFLCSGKIGGEGINLTSANHAIFYNRWWNPSNNSQARDRIIRIGQKKKVFIYDLSTSKTIEENVSTILDSKKKITNEVIENMVSKI